MQQRPVCAAWTNKSQGEDMADFRCYCLHDDGRIASGEYIEVDDLSDAIRTAYEFSRSHPTRAYRYVEVWRGSKMLYFSPREQGRREPSPSHASP
jgi:hypothetical protein